MLHKRALSLDTTPPRDYEPETVMDFSRASLTEIADHFGSDKGSLKHNYTKVYESLLVPLRNAPVNLLEIGVACGASLKMWSRYFQSGRIVGVDIRPECADLCKFYPNVGISIADATKRPTGITGNWDVIVDDGSHIAGHIVRAFELHWPLLNPGGLYIVEDLRCTYNPNYNVPFLVDPADKERGNFMYLVDRLMRECDRGGDVDSMQFWRELLVVRKK